MSDRHVALALRWLEKADHDIITAQQTLLLPHGPTDTPCFHAQQAVEKALKAFWCTGILPPFTHLPLPTIHATAQASGWR